MIYDSVLDTIGSTPIVRLGRLPITNGSEVLVKLEGANPGRSIKDRPALAMIDKAAERGEIKPGTTLIESTSGNLGKALAMIGAARGYKVILVVDPKVPRSVLQYVEALGAEIEMVDEPDSNGGYQASRIRRVKARVAADSSLYWPDQYNNPDNPSAHYTHTAAEVLADVPNLDILVAAVSTGGHVTGLARAMKEVKPRVKVVGVDAIGSAAFGFTPHQYAMRGLGLAWKPGNLDRSVVDFVHRVSDKEGIGVARALARLEAILVGESAGAAIFSALHFAIENPNSVVVAIAADDGANYLNESYNNDWLREKSLFEGVKPFLSMSAHDLVDTVARPQFAPDICGHPAQVM